MALNDLDSNIQWCIETITTYKFFSNELQIKVNGEPRGVNLPKTFARTGISFSKLVFFLN